MGSHCSIEAQIAENELESEIPEAIPNHSKLISECFKLKNYKEYSLFQELFSSKIYSIIDRIADSTGFNREFKRNRLKSCMSRLPSSNYRFRSSFSMIKLFNIMQTLYYKINTIYSNSYCFSKKELGKVTFDLISRYLSYEENFISDETENITIADKVIRRLNFFTEELPLKMKRLDKILKSKQIYVSGYDSNYRLTFYICPYRGDRVRHPKSGVRKISSIDYVTYIFFVTEFVLPSLVEIYHFSEEINIYMDFEGNPVDHEMIRIILHYLNSIYPLSLNIACIDNFSQTSYEISDLTENLIAKEDPFNCVVVSDLNFKPLIRKHFSMKCLPEKYGGMNDFNLNEKLVFVDQLCEFLLNSILIQQS